MAYGITKSWVPSPDVPASRELGGPARQRAVGGVPAGFHPLLRDQADARQAPGCCPPGADRPPVRGLAATPPDGALATSRLRPSSPVAPACWVRARRCMVDSCDGTDENRGVDPYRATGGTVPPARLAPLHRHDAGCLRTAPFEALRHVPRFHRRPPPARGPPVQLLITPDDAVVFDRFRRAWSTSDLASWTSTALKTRDKSCPSRLEGWSWAATEAGSWREHMFKHRAGVWPCGGLVAEPGRFLREARDERNIADLHSRKTCWPVRTTDLRFLDRPLKVDEFMQNCTADRTRRPGTCSCALQA